MGRKKKKRNIEKSTLKSLITSILRQNPRKAFNYKQLSKQIGVGDENTKRLIQILLDEMEQHDFVISVFRFFSSAYNVLKLNIKNIKKKYLNNFILLILLFQSKNHH